MNRRLFCIVWVSLAALPVKAQNYQALHGSSFAGSLGVANNPASIVHVPYSWDVTPLAVQAKHSTNAVVIKGLSLASASDNIEVNPVSGRMERFLMSNQDMRVLNARIRLNGTSAIAFGAAVRSYQSVRTSAFNWQDSITDVRRFMSANFSNSPLTAEIRGNAWAEMYGSYAKTIIDNDNSLLNAGVTIRINRGLGGAFVTASDLYQAPGVVHGQNGYLLNNGQLEFGYSSNWDILDSSGTSQQKRKRFLEKTWSAASLSLGAEYIIPAEDGDFYSYDLKIGVALLDLGYNKFQYSPNSRTALLNRGNISDSLIQASFENLGAASEVPDSVAVVAGNIQRLNGYFKIFQPARLVLNADKRITGRLFINAELTMPLTPVLGKKKLYVRDMNLLAITPRFETRAFGVYLPVTYNTRSQLWVGGAVKAGPLLAGIHNFANLFAKDKMQNGGAYLAFNIRPWSKKEKEENDGRTQSGRDRGGRKKGNRLGCPANVM